ncbi:MAG: hypothetical protein ACRD5K_15655 [Candidatus Acidiferrales bacterium]
MNNHNELARANGRIGKHVDIGRPGVPTARLFVFTLIFALAILGCGGVDTIWSTQLRSPDGRWLASAETVEKGGFGTASLETSVDLKWTDGSESPKDILVLIHDPYSASKSINLSMKWVTPSHLDVSYTGKASVALQVVKYGDVDISLHDRSIMRDNNQQ